MKIEKFEKRLIDTMHWCHSEMVDNHVRAKTPGSQFFKNMTTLQPPNVTELRRYIEHSAHMRGAVLRRFAPADVMGKMLRLRNDSLEAEVTKVCVQRAEAVIQRHHERTDSIAMAKGRLLFFDPAQSLPDGKAMIASGGFFDVEAFPPSDTWIAYVVEKPSEKELSGYLLAWVPLPVDGLIEEAMKASATDCLRWAAKVKTPFMHTVRERMGQTI